MYFSAILSQPLGGGFVDRTVTHNHKTTVSLVEKLQKKKRK
jgi:hypothetical protein